MKLESYVCGEWKAGSEEGKKLIDASTGELIGFADASGINIGEAVDFAKTKALPILSKMTFHERARMLKALALHLIDKKDLFYKESFKTGATKIDSWIDIEGGIGNLFVMSSKGRRELPNLAYLVEGKYEQLSKNGTFGGHHILVPKNGIAVHINAFNFPIWGMLEKIAVNLLSGVPAIVKPASITCYLTKLMVQVIDQSNILPIGSLQLLCGHTPNILDQLTNQDVVTFTGSASTALKLKSHENILKNNIPFNVEADSLNSCILGQDVSVDSPEFDLFIKEVSKEMTIKAGQKCTAVRRTIVPAHLIEAVSKALQSRLEKIVIGDPRIDGTRMGPLAHYDQVSEVNAQVNRLLKSCKELYTHKQELDKSGAFYNPKVLLCENPLENNDVHSIEAFGPVTTLLPYQSTEEAIKLANLGEGSLVGSIVTSDNDIAKEVVLGTSPYHGRFLVLNQECAKESTGHGSPMPQLVHGGPGRAGGGEEMGGLRGIHHYMQRTAIQGSPSTLTKITEVYQPKSIHIEKEVHPFRKHFHELEIGETLKTHKRTITETDIVNFANVSWDHFYAHTDATSLEGTFFEKRVAHGYFILAAAAGLFVDPKKGPVLANYGLDEFRFIEPVYVGTTISVNLTVKEKIDQEVKEEDAPRGIVKWQVEVLNESDETIALGTILTLVKK